MPYYMFSQNNSGGYFDVNDYVCSYVVIEADSEQSACEKFTPMIENQSPSCECCGDRWYMSPRKVDSDFQKIANNGFCIGTTPTVIVHHANGVAEKYFREPKRSEILEDLYEQRKNLKLDSKQAT